MKHGVLGPVALVLADCEPLEELAASFEIFLDGRDQQLLAKPSRPAQKYVLRIGNQPIDIFCLIDIQQPFFPNFRERLNTDGI